MSLTLTYLGLKADTTSFSGSHPQFRLDLQQAGAIRHFDVAMQTTWEASKLLAEVTPKLPSKGIDLLVKTVTASAESVRIQVITSMRVLYEGNWDMLGFDVLDVASELDTPETILLRWLAGRKQASLEETAQFLAQSEPVSQAMLNHLVEQGTLVETREQDQVLYRVHFAARRRRQATPAVWQALDGHETITERRHQERARKGMWLMRMKELVQGEYGRFWLALSPLLFLFLLTEWLLVQRLESFSQVVGFVGVVAVPVVAGIFPVLLLYASRRKGEYVPEFVLRFLAHPLIVGAVYLVAIGMLFLHGLLIWQNPLQRAIALLVGVIVVATTFLMARQGTFARRLVIEIRQESAEEGVATFTITDSGEAATQAQVSLDYANRELVYQGANGSIPEFPTLSSATFQLRDISALELLVWLHRVTPEGYSQQLPTRVKVWGGQTMREFQMDEAGKPFVFLLREVMKQEQNNSPDGEGQLAVEVQFAT